MSGDARPESVSEGLALLEHHFFASADPGEKYLRADSFRENVIRLIVFDMHLAIEELLRAHILRRALRARRSAGMRPSTTSKAFRAGRRSSWPLSSGRSMRRSTSACAS